MKGFVRYMNMKNAMVGVETYEGFTILEIRERCAMDISDIITGSLHSLGTGTLHNVTRGEDFKVSIEHIHCSGAKALELLA
jgi:hypothetical protein